MIILALDTASRYCSAALYIDGEITAEQMLSNGLVHSRTLMPMVDGVLSGCGIAPSDVDIFACSNGPGSFTGIRIAVSTVKGLALPYGSGHLHAGIGCGMRVCAGQDRLPYT